MSDVLADLAAKLPKGARGRKLAVFLPLFAEILAHRAPATKSAPPEATSAQHLPAEP